LRALRHPLFRLIAALNSKKGAPKRHPYSCVKSLWAVATLRVFPVAIMLVLVCPYFAYLPCLQQLIAKPFQRLQHRIRWPLNSHVDFVNSSLIARYPTYLVSFKRNSRHLFALIGIVYNQAFLSKII